MSRQPLRFIAAITMLAGPAVAGAYVGPGLGLGAIAAFLGAVLAVLLAIVGLVWYPVKRLLRKRKGAESAGTDVPGDR